MMTGYEEDHLLKEKKTIYTNIPVTSFAIDAKGESRSIRDSSLRIAPCEASWSTIVKVATKDEETEEERRKV